MTKASDIQEETAPDATADAPAAAAEAADPAGEAAAASDPETEALRVELKQTKDKLLRQVAEFQNYRRRTDQEKGSLLHMGQVQVVQRMLEVLDDFSRSLEAAAQLEGGGNEPAFATFREGIELVYRKFQDELSRLGVEPIDAVGQPFNENEHEALMQQPALGDTAPGTVIGELQKGYRMGDRVIRHSKVVVAS